MNHFKKYAAAAVIAIVLLFDLSLGLSRLGTYSAVDEPYWTYGRIPKFWTAVAQEKWKSTNINDKPGITVAILSGFGLTKYDPMAYKSLRGDVKTDQQLADIDNINFSFRLPIFLFCLAMLPLFYILLKRIFGGAVALTGFLLIALSPILLGISMIINPDSLLWTFLPLGVLSYLVFRYRKGPDDRYLYLSGLFLGLSLLTKYVSNVLYVFYFFLPFLEYVLAEEKPPLRPFLRKSLRDYVILVLISMAVFFILFPATWAHPDILLKGTFLSKVFESTWPIFAAIIIIILTDLSLFGSKATAWALGTVSRYRLTIVRSVTGIFLAAIVLVILDTYLGMKPVDFEGILSSPKGIGSDPLPQRYLGAILADFSALVFGIHPLAFLGLLAGLVLALGKKAVHSVETKTSLFFVIFILLYYLGSTVNDTAATVRYQIALYPLALIIAAIGLVSAWKTATTRLAVLRKTSVTGTAAFALLLVIIGTSVLLVKPYYFSYASALLPEPYLLNTKDMGDGSFEAAAYLNALPDARTLSVWSDKGAVCAEFVGTCTIGFSKKDLTGKHFDYFIISMGRENRSLKLSGSVNDIVDFRKVYGTETYVKNFVLGGRPENFVRIIPADAIK